MFSYYGSKSKIARYYPVPKYGTIIEPFAGSARYSLLHWENDVYLYDLSPYVAEVWKYLIQASEKDILGLPDVPSKIHIDNFTQLSQVEKWLIGFEISRAKSKPRKTGHGMNSWSAKKRENIAANLRKIRHWNVSQRSYADIPVNLQATYFVDPPYIETQRRPGNGDRYPHGDNLNYDDLAAWIKTRNGLVIACEGKGADYLPFEFFRLTNAMSNGDTSKFNYEYAYIRDR